MSSPIELLNEQFEAQSAQIRDLEFKLEESLASKLMRLEDVGWTSLTPGNDEGPTLDLLHTLTPNLQDLAAVNPWHKRGAQLRHAYIFGRGLILENTDKIKALIEDPNNQDALFGVKGQETANLALFADGNFFVLRDATNTLSVVPLKSISGEVTDPIDPSKVRYFQVSDINGKKTWYPVARYKKSQVGRGRRGTLPKTINKVAVSQDTVIYHQPSTRQPGWTYGIPDSLAATVWTVAYAEYLQDNAKLVKALQRIAWTVQAATKAGANNAAVQVANPGVGGTAVMGGGNVLANAGVPSAQVDFNHGQPLIAAVATSLGVPVIALISSPGASGGTYGVSASLDAPTIIGFTAVQRNWGTLLVEVLRDMGATEAKVSFQSIDADPEYRRIQSIVQSKAAGLLHQDEARQGVLTLLDVPSLHSEMPPDNPGYTPPAQGVTGTVPGGFDNNSTASASEVQ